MVVFHKGNSYVIDNRSGAKTPISEENGVFYLNVWVPRNRKQEGMFGAVRDSEQGFVGQATCIP